MNMMNTLLLISMSNADELVELRAWKIRATRSFKEKEDDMRNLEDDNTSLVGTLKKRAEEVRALGASDKRGDTRRAGIDEGAGDDARMSGASLHVLWRGYRCSSCGFSRYILWGDSYIE